MSEKQAINKPNNNNVNREHKWLKKNLPYFHETMYKSCIKVSCKFDSHK